VLRNGWFVVPHQVIFRDIDAFGHVNNAVFLTYFEIARTALWFAVTGGSHFSNINFIVARAEIDFRKQINMEEIEILIRFGALGRTSIETLYEIRKRNGDELAATGRVVVVLYDWARRSKMEIDDELRRKVTGYAGVGTRTDSSGSGAA
jgi:acyl-CoA thioester hydrolase